MAERTDPIRFELNKDKTEYCIDYSKVKSFKKLLEIFEKVGFNIIVEKWTVPDDVEPYMMKLSDFKANESGR